MDDSGCQSRSLTGQNRHAGASFPQSDCLAEKGFSGGHPCPDLIAAGMRDFHISTEYISFNTIIMDKTLRAKLLFRWSSTSFVYLICRGSRYAVLYGHGKQCPKIPPFPPFSY